MTWVTSSTRNDPRSPSRTRRARPCGWSKSTTTQKTNKQKKTDKNKRETHLDEDQVGEVVQVDEGLEHLLVQRRLLAEVVADRRLAQSLPSAIPKKKTPKNQNQWKTNRVSTLFWWVSQVDQASNRFWLVYFCNGCDSWFLGIQLGCHWVSLLIVFTGFNSSTRPLIGFDWFNFVMELSEFSMLLLVRFSKLKENDYQVVLGFTGFSNMTLGFMRFP